jgi:DNA repair protein RadC
MTETPLKPRRVRMGEKMKYAYSLKTLRVKETDFPYNGEQLTGTAELVNFVHRLQDSDVEKMIVIYLDAQNKLCGLLPIMGTVNQAVVYPREVLKHALLSGACALILCHNHPSGHTGPSEADIRLTKLIQDGTKLIDVQVHDHLIIGGEQFFSFREEGLM